VDEINDAVLNWLVDAFSLSPGKHHPSSVTRTAEENR